MESIRKLFQLHPNTTCLAVSRKGCALINNLALSAFFPDLNPVVTLPGDLESNPNNYADGKFLTDPTKLRSLQIPIYIGMEVFFTRNVNKDIDYVNGMKAQVIGWNAESKGLHLVTATGKYVTIWKWTDREIYNRSYYPIRPGYCSTIVKYQGAELEHVTVYLDVPGVPGSFFFYNKSLVFFPLLFAKIIDHQKHISSCSLHCIITRCNIEAIPYWWECQSASLHTGTIRCTSHKEFSYK